MAVESTQSDRELVERGWAALPPEYRVPDRRPTLEEAHDYCRRLAESHYENFHVASWFLPRRLSRGGLEILHAIERQDYDVLRNRPAISKGRKLALLLRALSKKLLAGLAGEGSAGGRQAA
ncbi:MAG TPA: hypothetical protein VGM27_00825 [Acidobacteriaceae bacterium]